MSVPTDHEPHRQADLYDLRIGFERGSREPARLFVAMAGMIDAFARLDSDLLGVFCGDVRTTLVLDDVQTGSLRSILRNVLELVDDDALKSGEWRRVVGHFLYRAKQAVLRWCNRGTEITDPDDVLALVKLINDLALETRFQALPHYKAFTPRQLVRSTRALQRATGVLLPSDQVTYTAGGDAIPVYPIATFSQEIVDLFLIPVPEIRAQTCVLVIKKPDYLADSQWEFRRDNRVIKASIDDPDWLSSFRRRQFEIRPGDALRVNMESKTVFDEDGVASEASHRVLSVHGIVQGDPPLRQPDLPALGSAGPPHA